MLLGDATLDGPDAAVETWGRRLVRRRQCHRQRGTVGDSSSDRNRERDALVPAWEGRLELVVALPSGGFVLRGLGGWARSAEEPPADNLGLAAVGPGVRGSGHTQALGRPVLHVIWRQLPLLLSATHNSRATCLRQERDLFRPLVAYLPELGLQPVTPGYLARGVDCCCCCDRLARCIIDFEGVKKEEGYRDKYEDVREGEMTSTYHSQAVG